MDPNFIKTITISGLDYAVSVYTDIHNEVSIDAPVVLGITHNGTSILTDQSVINTNNRDIDANLYTGINPTLAVALAKHIYNSNTDTYSYTPISQNIKDLTQTYYQYSVLGTATVGGATLDKVISISSIAIPSTTTNGTAITSTLEPNVTYSIVLDFNILLDIPIRDENLIVYIDFITKGLDINESMIKKFSDSCANVIYRMNNLDALDDVRNCFIEPNPMNYKFAPVKKDENGIYLKELDPNNNDVVVEFDIANTLENMFINQYLNEFRDYFALLDSELELTPEKSSKLLRETKEALFTRSNLINSFAKGTIKGIELVFGLFCNNIGEYTFKVENSPLGTNFIYRITSDMPKVYWTSIIKDIVHPISWRDEYIQIDNGASQLPTGSWTHTDPATVMYDAYSINFRDYYKRYKTIITALRTRPMTYLDVNHGSMYNGDTRFYDMSSIENMTASKKFNFTPNEYEVSLRGYGSTDLIAELNARDNYIDRSRYISATQSILFDVEFAMNGIALEYYFQIIHNGKIIQRLKSNSPRYRGQLPISMMGQLVQLDITLTNGEFSTIVSHSIALPWS